MKVIETQKHSISLSVVLGREAKKYRLVWWWESCDVQNLRPHFPPSHVK